MTLSRNRLSPPLSTGKVAFAAEGPDHLFHRVALGDHAAFRKIFDMEFATLCSYANRLVSSPELAEEIVSDVFLTLWRNRCSIHISTSFRAYLFTCVRNRALDCLRQLRRERGRMQLEHAEKVVCGQSIASEVMMLDELHHRIHAAVLILPPQCRLVFQLSREEDLKYKEIAERLNISIKTVDTQINRALKHLRKALSGYSR